MLEIVERDCYEFFEGGDGKLHSYWMTTTTCAIIKIDGKIEKIIVPASSGYDCEDVFVHVLSEEEFLKKYTWERLPS